MLSIKNLVVSLKNEDKKILDGLDLEIKDLPTYGVIGKITSNFELPNGNTRISILGVNRAHVYSYLDSKRKRPSDTKQMYLKISVNHTKLYINRKVTVRFNVHPTVQLSVFFA